VWVIRDGARKISTGKAAKDRTSAERALRDYLADKYQPNRTRNRSADQVLIADVLSIYMTDVVPAHARPEETKQRILTLDSWWAERTLAAVTGKTCRQYVVHRVGQAWKSARPESTGNRARTVTAAAARRELEDLRAAINHHRREGLCSEVVSVALPDKTPAREQWLTRSEAARLLWAAWRAREIQRHGRTNRYVGRHVARFILTALYTGSRSAAICGAALMPTVGRGYIDLESGVFYRRASGERETKKRQPPAPISARLLAHIRRWRRLGIAQHAVVEWNGKPVKSVRRAFGSTVRAAEIERVTPHVLRHTAATWLARAGVDLWKAAGLLGMTVETLQRVYAHHHPDYLRDAAEALGRQNGDRLTVNKRRQTQSNVTKITEKSKAAQ
jgi:integrase